MATKIMEFDILLKYFILDNVFFYPKSLVLFPKMVLLLECMVLVAIYILIPGYYRIHGNACLFSV